MFSSTATMYMKSNFVFVFLWKQEKPTLKSKIHIEENFVTVLAVQKAVKFTYSEKAKKLEKSPTLFWRYYVTSVAFSEYVNFTIKSLLMQDWVFKLGVGECIFAHGANGPDRPSMNLIDITIMLAFVAKDFRPKTRQVLVCCTMWLKNVWMSIL